MPIQPMQVQFACPKCAFPFEASIINNANSVTSEDIEQTIKEILDPHFLSVHKNGVS